MGNYGPSPCSAIRTSSQMNRYFFLTCMANCCMASAGRTWRLDEQRRRELHSLLALPLHHVTNCLQRRPEKMARTSLQSQLLFQTTCLLLILQVSVLRVGHPIRLKMALLHS